MTSFIDSSLINIDHFLMTAQDLYHQDEALITSTESLALPPPPPMANAPEIHVQPNDVGAEYRNGTNSISDPNQAPLAPPAPPGLSQNRNESCLKIRMKMQRIKRGIKKMD